MQHTRSVRTSIASLTLVLLLSLLALAACGNSLSKSHMGHHETASAIVKLTVELNEPVVASPCDMDLVNELDGVSEINGEQVRVAMTEAKAPARVRAAAVGDSLIAHGEAVRTLERLQGYAWDNHGVIGNTTRNILNRADDWGHSVYADIVILGGINDMSERVPASWTIENLREVYRLAGATGARVIAVTSLPWRGNLDWSAAEQRDQDEINAWILSGADGLVDVTVDAFSALESEPGSDRLDPLYRQPDRLHLSEAGQQRLAQAIIDTAYSRDLGDS